MRIFEDITVGDILSIITILIGFIHQYVYVMQRIAKLEVECNRNKEDIDKLYVFLKNHVSLKD